MSDTARQYIKTLSKGRISASARSCLFFVADYHNVKQGFAWPGIGRLAADMDMSVRQVRRLLAEGQAAGVIRYSPGIGRGNSGQIVFLELIKADTGVPFSELKGDIKGDIFDSAIRNEPLNQDNPPIVPPICEKHPDSGLTNWGTCWSCYSEKHSGLRKEPQRAAG
jgi:hypothetical protein